MSLEQRIEDAIVAWDRVDGDMGPKALSFAIADDLRSVGIRADGWGSRPAETDMTYYITILADEPLDTLTMHGRVLLLADDGRDGP